MLVGFRHLKGHFDRKAQLALMDEIRAIITQAPLYTATMPRTGKPLSVRMSNAGELGWVSDIEGYRYQPCHPETGRPWPPIPESLLRLWRDIAQWPGDPEACLVNYYGPDAKMGSHVDRDEAEVGAPVISVSLGDRAVFHLGGLKRSDPKWRMVLSSGDVVVLGGEARLAYHGVDRIMAGSSDLLREGGRFNLTLRRVTPLPAA